MNETFPSVVLHLEVHIYLVVLHIEHQQAKMKPLIPRWDGRTRQQQTYRRHIDWRKRAIGCENLGHNYR